jgi:hypothetical protein
MKDNSRRGRKARDPLPKHFRTLEQAAAFWDAHDSGEYEEYFKDVDVEVNLRREVFLVSLQGDLYRKVRSIARRRRVSPARLLHQWVREKVA